MKKQLVASLAAAMVLGVAGTSFAAANPFVDVPAKHWAYASVMTLSQAGIVDGDNGKFMGDKMISRYEMAQIVAKAMAKSDKADAKQKAMIEKLAAEFSEELTTIGVRVTKLENNASNIKFTGALRLRMESTEGANPNTEYKTRLRLMMSAPIDNNWTFKGRYGQESKAGEVNGNAQVDQAYVTGEAFGLSNVAFGRMPLFLGKGLVMDSTANWDGLKVSAGKDLKVYAGAVKKNFSAATAATSNTVRTAKDGDVALKLIDVTTSIAVVADGITNKHTVIVPGTAAVAADNRTFVFANAAYAVNKNLDLTASYFADQGKKTDEVKDYDTIAVGTTFKGIENIAITAEFAKNRTDKTTVDAKATSALVKYKGANAAKVGTFGLMVGYTKAEAGFDTKGYTTADVVDAYKAANDIKGYTYGAEYTVMKNGVFNLQYTPATNYLGTVDKKFVIANFNYSF